MCVYNTTMSVHLSIQLKQKLAKNENGKGTMGCGSGWGYRGGWLGKGKGRCKNMLFGVPCTIYVHYFKNIRQGALQSDCV